MFITYIFPWIHRFQPNNLHCNINMALLVIFLLFAESYFHSQNLLNTEFATRHMKFHLSNYRACKGHFKGHFIVWPYIRSFPLYLLPFFGEERMDIIWLNWAAHLKLLKCVISNVCLETSYNTCYLSDKPWDIVQI